MYSLRAHGVYILNKGAPVTGVAYGDYLAVDPRDNDPYMLVRILTRQEAEEILAADGCRLACDDGPHLEVVR